MERLLESTSKNNFEQINATKNLFDKSGKAYSPQSSIPHWYKKHMKPTIEFASSLNPNPFDQPNDLSGYITLHQNDYFRLGNHPAVVDARRKSNDSNKEEAFLSSIYGSDSSECETFRRNIQKCMKAGDAMLTTSGWAANLGLLEAITPLFAPIYLDKLAHASLFDGAKLSLGKPVVVKHNDPDDLLARIKVNGPGIVVIDAVYSTDGSIGDIKRFVEICEQNDCVLILDEAHSFGIFGNGGGLAVELGLEDRIHFRTVSLNKALGGHGGLIAGNKEMMKLVKTRCRSVIFSSATSSVSAAGHNAALNIIENEPWRAKKCLENAEIMRSKFSELNIDTGDSKCQIISIVFDNEQSSCAFYKKMRKDNILTSVFLYPATPLGHALVRFSVHSELTPAEIDKTVSKTAEHLRSLNLLK